MVESVMGVMKAGGGYVPLDPSYPQERIAFMLEDSGARVLLTQQKFVDLLPDYKAERVCLDQDWPLIAEQSAEDTSTGVTPDNLAYVIYTSGSTGMPKGVMVSHRSIANRLLWEQRAYPLTESDRVLQITSLNFDVSVCEIFGALCSGAQLYLAAPEGHKDVPYIISSIAEQGITFINLVPSMLQVLIEDSGFESCKTLSRVYCGGEAMPPRLKERFFARSSARLVNLYGPTEATVDTTYWICEAGGDQDTVPIGLPIDNVEVFLLDAHLGPVPVGITGELYVGGSGLARGYLNRPDLTAERFVPHPFAIEADARLYVTGDLARRLPDGSIAFLGRSDEQVKIRGLRIELGEIENVLMRHAGVGVAVVTVTADARGGKHLAAYIVADPGKILTPGELREFASERLPDYMVPTWFVPMRSLPSMPNGKVDRGALPPPETVAPEPARAFAPPCNDIEEKLASIWAESLGIERVGRHDNFFQLGGDSILSIQVTSRAEAAGIRVSARQLFQHQTIAELARVAGTAPALVAEQGVITGEAPLTPIQRWFFEQGFAEQHHWNQSILLESARSLAPAIMKRAVEAILKHHDALRMRFRRDATAWRQVIVGVSEEVPFLVVDLSSLPIAEQQKAVEAKAAEAQSGLNLSEGPLIRVCQFDLGINRPCLLLMIIHHLVVDAVSWRILLEDMRNSYEQLSNGEAVNLGRKTSSFKQWAELLAEYVRSDEARRGLGYWQGELDRDVARLPVDYPDGANTEASAREVSAWLNKEETRALLNDVPASYRMQVNDALIATLAEALTLWVQSGTVLVEVERHGREEIIDGVDLSRTVGWFTTIYPIALRLDKSRDIANVLKEVKQQLRAIPERGISYGVLRYLSEDPAARRLQEVAQPEISFNYLGHLDRTLGEDGGFRLARQSPGPLHSGRAARSHLLEIECRIIQGCLQIIWGYSENIHRREAVERASQAFADALRRLIAHCRSGESSAFTPSDFPEAKLSQAELDRLIAGITGASKE
jgi:amino acid adenylation domain-containing protein/non-ribosomal peptide synthase protein (TIGR01720 family)